MADSFGLMPTFTYRRDSFSINLLRMKIPRHELPPLQFEFQHIRVRFVGRGSLDVEVIKLSRFVKHRALHGPFGSSTRML